MASDASPVPPTARMCKISNNRFCKHTTRSIIHTPGRYVDGSATCVARGRAAVAASIAMNAKRTCKLSNVLAAWCVAAIVCTCIFGATQWYTTTTQLRAALPNHIEGSF